MKYLAILLIICVFTNSVLAGKSHDKEDKCHKHETKNTCHSEDDCHWNDGYCLNQCDCSDFSPDECANNDQCAFTETDNGACSVKDFGCIAYGKDQCIATPDYCLWTSNFVCSTLPGFNANCPAKTPEECLAATDYCAYNARCVNNLFPSQTWDLCKADCEANPIAHWVTFQPEYCVDNVHFCEDLTIDECREHTEHCDIEYIFNQSDIDQYGLNQCSDKDAYKYSQKCKALLYGCQNLTIDECRTNEFCLVIDEIGQCYPNDLPNCLTLTAEDCLNYPNCCLEQACTNLPGIGETCPELTPEECETRPECFLVDQGNCSDIDYNCDLEREECLAQVNYCLWNPDVTAYCYNKFDCEGLNKDDCKKYCDICDWQRDVCSQYPLVYP